MVGTKGRGSNMLAIIEASRSEGLPASVELVIAPGEQAPALAVAAENGVKTAVVPAGDSYADEVGQALKDNGIEMICLAGYMRLLSLEILQKYPNRVLNIHPALLPKFGGKGMYGHHVHEAVLAAGEQESGCTVHYVSEQYDEGAIIHQRRCPVLPDDTPETLAARVLKEEHLAYPEAIRMVLSA